MLPELGHFALIVALFIGLALATATGLAFSLACDGLARRVWVGGGFPLSAWALAQLGLDVAQLETQKARAGQLRSGKEFDPCQRQPGDAAGRHQPAGFPPQRLPGDLCSGRRDAFARGRGEAGFCRAHVQQAVEGHQPGGDYLFEERKIEVRRVGKALFGSKDGYVDTNVHRG